MSPRLCPTATQGCVPEFSLYPNDDIVALAKIRRRLADRLEAADRKTPLSLALWHIKMASDALMLEI